MSKNISKKLGETLLDGKEQEIIEKYKNGLSTLRLGEEYGVSHTTIGNLLKKNNIKLDKFTHSRTIYKYQANVHYLDELDCQEKFYFLGFFFADGNCHRKTGRVSIKLQQRDRSILEKFNLLFENTKSIKDEERFNNSYKKIQYSSDFIIYSMYLINRLEELGAPPNKSLILKFPTYIPDNYLNHFIRGYFDGDGTIGIRNNWSNGPLCNISMIGTEDFLTGIKNSVERILKIKSIRIYKVKEANCWKLDLAVQKDIKIFLEWLYNDSLICLERKHDKALEFLNNRNFDIETRLERSKRVRENFLDIIAKYKEGYTIGALAKENKCGTQLIKSVLLENNVKTRPKGYNLIKHS